MKIKILSFFIFCFFVSNSTFSQTKKWSLEACIDQAVRNNLLIKKADLVVATTKENLIQVQGNRIPVLNATASQNFNFGRSIDPVTNQFAQNTIASNNIGLNGSLMLFNGFQNNNLIHQNQLNIEASQYDLEKSKNDIVLNVMGYYLQILLFGEQLKVAALTSNSTNIQIERLEKLYEKGNATADQFYKLKAQAALDAQNTIAISNNLSQSKLALCQQMQIDYTDDFLVDSLNSAPLATVVHEPADAFRIYGLAEKSMPQIQAGILRIKSSLAGISTARGAYLPRLNIYGGAYSIYSDQNKQIGGISGFNNVTTGFVNNNPAMPVYMTVPSYERQDIAFSTQLKNNFYQNLGIQLTIPILNSNLTKTNIAKARINADLASLNLKIQKDQLRMDIEVANQNVLAAARKFDASKNQVQARMLSYGFDEKRFNAGILNIYNYLEEKNNLARSELEFVQSKYDLLFKKKILDFYEGQLNFK